MLCAEDGTALGTAPKATVHSVDTPLHLAFSCYIFDPSGRVLVTRRARTKKTFPGVRTNSCCGHPAPDEGMRAAVHRRVEQELGIALESIDLILPAFRYRAVAADGTVENELCPVYRARIAAGEVSPDPDEVDAAWWQPWEEFLTAVDDTADPLSHWASEQIRALRTLGPDPVAWATGEPALLPAGATP